ncbi:MAG TPA: phosphate/phosphite/phosphonate ABC transporter substrate-binding protein [Candidatus Polarisedimenticolaceae bacterium]|nr:phosphate/phosphite/phosphonate ABC transporter substrate-binding protein [Candidatus Polarisedimenticolaceae bacterium]
MRTLTLGAVAYDPKVVTIWEGFKDYFIANGLKFDFVLYSNYERMVDGQFDGEIQVAWNSPLAWIEAERLATAVGREASAIAMRDTDRDLTSVIVVKTGSPVRTLADLRGKTVAVGASDSPQATLIPLLLIAESGLTPGVDFTLIRHDLLVGKHGDHIGGEREAARALIAERADAACMIDANHLGFSRDGTLPAGSTRVLAQTPPYDHCNFTVLGDAPKAEIAKFTDLLLRMSYDDPAVRGLLDLEGLKKWMPGRTEGYTQLGRAVDAFDTLGAWLAGVGQR